MRNILFVSGTRADFGKLKPLLLAVKNHSDFGVDVFTTGMHMLSRYGSTWQEVSKVMEGRIHPYLNQGPKDSMDQVLSKTIMGLADYVAEKRPDLIVVHGDRVEALAGAIVGCLNNILVAHIEGGEVSGTIDELLRHSISKLSHVHFVSNSVAANRLIRMGEDPRSVYQIGSPDVDIMLSPDLPSLDEARDHYDIEFSDYHIVILHPVTTEVEEISQQTRQVLEFIATSKENFIVIESNNDTGSEVIYSLYKSFPAANNVKFFPSMRFEYFLAFLRSAKTIIGNSSAGVREAPYFGVPAVNLGSRQLNRAGSPLIINADFSSNSIRQAVEIALGVTRAPSGEFGSSGSAQRFINAISAQSFWGIRLQKQFLD
jgi:UDP-N-acetylglucosamine 2-epimerase (hydrolysing)